MKHNLKTTSQRINEAASSPVNYDKWRRGNNGKAVCAYLVRMEDSLGNKETYKLSVVYHETAKDDKLSFKESLYGGWESSGTSFALSNMQNKPAKMFDGDGEVIYDNEASFNKQVIDVLTQAEERPIKALVDSIADPESEGSGMESVIKTWMDTGVAGAIKKIEFVVY